METEKRQVNKRRTLAILLIGIGFIWLIRKTGFYTDFPLFFPQFPFFPHPPFQFIFSWQVILILTGLLLLAGKRSVGTVLVLVGGIFLLPEILPFHHLTFSFVLPLLLIVVGIAIVYRTT